MSDQPLWFKMWVKFLKRQNELNRITKKDVEYLTKNRPSITDLAHLNHKLRSNANRNKKRLKSRSKKKK